MRIGIIDADLIGVKKHRFPNLCCMKISSYYKNSGDEVVLLQDYNSIDEYDKVFISKVFIKTDIPFEKDEEKTEQNVIEHYKDNPILNKPNVEYGGTGFFYDKSPKLPNEIEHTMPDYHLYDEYIEWVLKNEKCQKTEFEYFTDYSIGFLTRGCFRKCQFCVNKNYDRCSAHSNIMEFYDPSRPRLCFLDDNFFACPNWKDIIEEVKKIGKPFQFRQGLDERLLTKDKIEELTSWKYDKTFNFAFDNIEDRGLIESKLNLLYEVKPDFKKAMTFYVFCGFDRSGKYDEEFWREDIKNVLVRLKILAKYSAFGYVMRHENYKNAPDVYKQMYMSLAGWANLPSYYINHSFKEYCLYKGSKNKNAYMEFGEIDDFIPKEIAQMGNWKYHKKRSKTKQEVKEEKRRELEQAKDKIGEVNDVTYRELCDILGITYYKGGSKIQQMDMFKEMYGFIEENGRYKKES